MLMLSSSSMHSVNSAILCTLVRVARSASCRLPCRNLNLAPSNSLFLIRQTQRKPADTELPQEKPQLDGETMMPKEAARREVQELDSKYLEPVEMDAGYVEAKMNRHSNVKQKPGPQSQQST
ncbi:hypothetical protein BDZ45DRAFT_757555 [Acephala macrosclerotiorum]|nr:hypothetical protein BDZ45DRAFT_757555 [Acephala macrosclerotiorum]